MTTINFYSLPVSALQVWQWKVKCTKHSYQSPSDVRRNCEILTITKKLSQMLHLMSLFIISSSNTFSWCTCTFPFKKGKKLKWGKSAEKWNSIMVVTIKSHRHNHEADKKSSFVLTISKIMYSATNVVFFFFFYPPLFKLVSTGIPSYTHANEHTHTSTH